MVILYYLLTILLRTLAYALITNIACLLIGYPLAFWIVQYGGKWKNLFLMMVVLPSWTCYLIRIYALRTLIAQYMEFVIISNS